MLEDNQIDNQNVSVETSEEKETVTSGEDQSPKISIRDSLSGKAARIYDVSEYTDEEFISMMQMYEETMKSIELGNIVKGKVLLINNDQIIVDIGFKSEGAIPLQEFGENQEINVGDEVEVFLDDFENQEGQLVLSKQKADFMKVWDKIKELYDDDQEVDGRLVRRIKGGIVVDLFGVDAFLPGSQIDIRQVKNFDQYIGETCKLKIIKINKLRRNIVVSRRAVLEDERAKMRQDVLADLEIDQVRKGMVKNITDFGAFIDLGGVDGLLHITDMSWGRINHPSELCTIGDTIDVKILSYEEGKTRISLGMKQLTDYPWDGVEEKYPDGTVVKGKVVSITDYGAFVELERGIEGLVHISEMSWTQHIKHPSKIVSVSDEIECKILSVNKAEEKISLGIKQLAPDPWGTIDERHPIGSSVQGKVRNLTNFGAFVEIEEGIDGLVHISDMSWTKRIKHPSEVMKKSESVDVVILDIDKAHRRISLGHKQIFEDPWATLEEKFAVGMVTTGTIIRILDRGVVVSLENNIEGFVPTYQLGQDIKKPSEAFNVGDELPMTVIEFEKDQRKIVLSVREYFKSRDKAEFEEFKEKYKPKPVTIGDAFSDIFEAPAPKKKDDVAVDISKDEEKETPESVPVSETPEQAAEEPVETVSESAGESQPEKTSEEKQEISAQPETVEKTDETLDEKTEASAETGEEENLTEESADEKTEEPVEETSEEKPGETTE